MLIIKYKKDVLQKQVKNILQTYFNKNRKNDILLIQVSYQ